MGHARNQFSYLDAEKHSRVADAVKSAVSAGFVSEKTSDPDSETFVRKSITQFVKEKITLEDLGQKGFSGLDEKLEESEGAESSEACHPESEPIEDIGSVSDNLADELVDPLNDDAQEYENMYPATPEAEQEHTEVYDEGFAAGRAAALSELEEQRMEHLNVLKSISERLQNESCFDFADISSKVLDTVYALASERCGIAIDNNPQGFLDHVEKKLEQIRSLSNEKKVFFNPQDLKTLQSFEEFENLFEGVDIREEESLIRGDVIVKIGGVEIRDTPFSDHKSG